MKITAKKLELRIMETEKAQIEFTRKREEMRQALRDHLATFDGTGELIGIARQLHVSIVQLSNLKGGYSIPSIATARNILKVSA